MLFLLIDARREEDQRKGICKEHRICRGSLLSIRSSVCLGKMSKKKQKGHRLSVCSADWRRDGREDEASDWWKGRGKDKHFLY